MNLEELIEMYERELQDLKALDNVKHIRDIPNVRYRTEAYAIQTFLVHLKNLRS